MSPLAFSDADLGTACLSVYPHSARPGLWLVLGTTLPAQSSSLPSVQCASRVAFVAHLVFACGVPEAAQCRGRDPVGASCGAEAGGSGGGQEGEAGTRICDRAYVACLSFQ